MWDDPDSVTVSGTQEDLTRVTVTSDDGGLGPSYVPLKACAGGKWERDGTVPLRA